MIITFASIVLVSDSPTKFAAGVDPSVGRRLVQSDNLIDAVQLLNNERETISQDLPITVLEQVGNVGAAMNKQYQRRGEIPGIGTLTIEHTDASGYRKWTFRNAACPTISSDRTGVGLIFTYNFIVGPPGYTTTDPDDVADVVYDGDDDWAEGTPEAWLDGGHFADTGHNARVINAGTWD